ncbi:hypothetical protein [Paenibacillus helianthi]|nr:hypothetical protein [Paenibacillus helianthi]
MTTSTFEILLKCREGLRRQPDLQLLAYWQSSFFLMGTDGKWF